MFKVQALVFGSIAAILLTHSPSVFAAELGETIPNQIDKSPEISGNLLGYYETKDGKIPIKEESGIAERLPAGTTLRDILENHPMSAEAEAKLVHREPKVPFFLDGALYEPEQIHLFDGQRLGFIIGENGLLYAFLSYDALESFLSEQQSSSKSGEAEYSNFYDLVGCTGIDQIMVLPNTTLHALSYFDNAISSAEISPYATMGATLFEYENLQGDYFHEIESGETQEDLGDYGWDNRASSLVVWP